MNPSMRTSHRAPLPLRLVLDYGFLEHGLAKLIRGPDAFATILHTLGVPAPHLMPRLTIVIEIAGGRAVLLGAFVTLASVPPAVRLRPHAPPEKLTFGGRAPLDQPGRAYVPAPSAAMHASRMRQASSRSRRAPSGRPASHSARNRRWRALLYSPIWAIVIGSW